MHILEKNSCTYLLEDTVYKYQQTKNKPKKSKPEINLEINLETNQMLIISKNNKFWYLCITKYCVFEKNYYFTVIQNNSDELKNIMFNKKK